MQWIAKALAESLSCTGSWPKTMSLPRLRDLQSKETVRSYLWPKAVDILNVKQQARFKRVGQRNKGDRRLGSPPGAGHEKAHLAVIKTTKLA